MYKTQYTFSPKYIHSPPLTPPLTDYDYVDKKNTPPSKSKTYNSKSYFKKFFIGLILTLLSIIAYKISLVLISRPTLEIVYSYYDEDLDEFSRFSNLVRQKLHWKFKITDTVYVKNESHSPILHKQLNKIVDNVAYLPNIGREGATYLHHITQRYKATIFPDDLNNQSDEILADKTLFLQPHPAWYWIMYDRLEHINVDTGYISLGPYVPGSCGVSEGHTLPQMKTIWQLFTNTECPEDETQLVTWAGQFMVSQDRILNNPYSKYADILSMLEAPPDDPIHSETPWWFMSKNDPSNPFIGHSLERSWPIIFDCNRPDFSDPEKCGGKAGAGSPESPFTVCFIGCFGVSAISHLISERYLSATYEKLDKNQKLDWNAHTVSLIHSLLIAPAAGYALYKSPIALTDTLYGYDSLIGNIHAFSLGYFLWDALHDVRTRQPVYLVHALVSFSAYLWTFRPVFMNIGPAFLLWEASTPFVNVNWFMDRIEGYKNSRSQIVNGIALTLSFFTARIAFGGYMSYIFYKTIVEHQNSFPKSLAAVYVAGNITLNILNLNWFYKMMKKIKRMYSRL